MTAPDFPDEVSPGADADYPNARIRLMKTLLRAGGFDVQEHGGAIRVALDGQAPFPCVVAFYGLSRHPEHVRARLTSAEPAGPRADQGIEEVRLRLQAPLVGEARIEPFAFHSPRGESRIYYAYVEIEKDIAAFIGRARAVEKVIAELSRLGAGGFREVLDQIDLPRSCVTRMALSRICRESGAPDDLMAAIAREARVVVGGRDWRTPRELKKNDLLPPFLRFIVRLLWEETSRYYMIQAWEDLNK